VVLHQIQAVDVGALVQQVPHRRDVAVVCRTAERRLHHLPTSSWVLAETLVLPWAHAESQSTVCVSTIQAKRDRRDACHTTEVSEAHHIALLNVCTLAEQQLHA
jgi:hypothetical protein